MSYVPSVASARSIGDLGPGSVPASSGAGISGGRAQFYYCSSDGTTIIAPAGGTPYFLGCGSLPFSSTGTAHPNILARNANNVGMRVGDLVVVVQSSAGATPGLTSLHTVTKSTFNGSTSVYSSSAGYDVTVSTSWV
jgi:hypothetical protein